MPLRPDPVLTCFIQMTIAFTSICGVNGFGKMGYLGRGTTILCYKLETSRGGLVADEITIILAGAESNSIYKSSNYNIYTNKVVNSKKKHIYCFLSLGVETHQKKLIRCLNQKKKLICFLISKSNIYVYSHEIFTPAT